MSSSCNNNDLDYIENDMVEMSFTATADNYYTNNSRTIINYTGKENTITFDSDESISIFTEENNFSTNYKFNNTPENNNTFTGNVTFKDSQSSKFYAIYPYNELNKVEKNEDGSIKFSVNIPEEQKVNNTFNIDNLPSAAIIENGSFNLIGIGSLIRILFEGDQEKISKIEKLTLKGKYGIVGNGYATFTNGVYTGALGTNKKDLTILPPDGGFKIGENYFVVVRPSYAQVSIYASINNEEKELSGNYSTGIDLKLVNGKTKVGNLYIKTSKTE